MTLNQLRSMEESILICYNLRRDLCIINIVQTEREYLAYQ